MHTSNSVWSRTARPFIRFWMVFSWQSAASASSACVIFFSIIAVLMRPKAVLRSAAAICGDPNLAIPATETVSTYRKIPPLAPPCRSGKPGMPRAAAGCRPMGCRFRSDCGIVHSSAAAKPPPSGDATPDQRQKGNTFRSLSPQSLPLLLLPPGD